MHMSPYGYATAPGYQSPYLASRPMATPPFVYSYLPHNPTPDEVEAYNHHARGRATTKHEMIFPRRSHTQDGSSSARSKSKPRRDKSLKRGEFEPAHFLDVQATPVYHRRSASRGPSRTHSQSRSRNAPSLTHSASTDDESEERYVSGPTTPHSVNVALWRDDVHDSPDGAPVPPPPAIPPHIQAQYEYAQHARRHYEPAGSASSSDYSSLVVPTLVPPFPSDLPSPAELDCIREEIAAIDYEVNSRILQFTFPTTLELGLPLPNGDASPLPNTARNRPLLEHRDYFERTFSRLDSIQSHNDQSIRSARKKVVEKVQDQLQQLLRMEKMVRDNMHYERWKSSKLPRIHVTCPSASQ